MPRMHLPHVAAVLEQDQREPPELQRKAYEHARARAALANHLLHQNRDGSYLLIRVGGVHSRHCQDLEAVTEILNRMGAPA